MLQTYLNAVEASEGKFVLFTALILCGSFSYFALLKVYIENIISFLKICIVTNLNSEFFQINLFKLFQNFQG